MLHGQRAAHRELVEERAREERLEARQRTDALLGVVGALQALFAKLTEALLAQRGEIDRRGDRQQ